MRGDPTGVESTRKILVPLWIRFFSWIFFGLACVVPLIQIIGLFNDVPMSLAYMGLQWEGDATEPAALAVQGLYLLLGIAGFGLLRGKHWALDAGLGAGALVLALSAIAIWTQWPLTGALVGWTPTVVATLAFLVTLARRRARWRSAGPV